MKRLHTALLVLFATTGTALPASAQGVTAADIVDAWDLMTRMVIDAAEAMPAEHYSSSPGEPLRNFANQINHTTESNIGFGASVNAGRPTFAIPDRSSPPQSKREVVELLQQSFAYFRGGLESLSDSDLSADVPWGPRNNQRMISRMKAILIVTSHLQREHGKTIMYLRAQGITPPPSGSWTF